jgi:uncharacterized protein (TIGR02246 family)
MASPTCIDIHQHVIQPEDEAAIRQLGNAWDEAWNRHDMSALAGLVTPNVDFIHVMGDGLEAGSPFRNTTRSATPTCSRRVSPGSRA